MRFFFLLVATLSVAAPIRAIAQTAQAPIVVTAPPVADTITLDDGTVITGRVSEVRLFEHATITRSDGVTFTVPWSRIRAMAADAFTLRAPSVQPPPGTPPAVFAATPDPPAALPAIAVTGYAGYGTPSPNADLRVPGPGRVPLYIRSRGAPIEIGVATPSLRRRRLFAAEPSAVLCSGPCTLYVVPGFFPLWFGSPSQRGMATELYVPTTGAAVEVTPGDDRARAEGGVLEGLGALGLVGGVIAASALGGSGDGETAALVAMGAGAAAFIAGTLIRATGRARVHTIGPAYTGW